MAELYGFADTPELAELLLKAGVPVIQYRNKTESTGEAVIAVRSIMKIAHSYPDARIIVNDSLEAALEGGAHGVHLGQDDGDYREVCRRYGETLLIGVSVDTVQEALEAEAAGVHYIGAGAVYGSETKPEAPHMGVPLLKDICRSVSLPVCAIGGIQFHRVDEIVQAGAGYVCVISDINNHSDPAARARKYLEKLAEA